jgi:hypothetical protein
MPETSRIHPRPHLNQGSGAVVQIHIAIFKSLNRCKLTGEEWYHVPIVMVAVLKVERLELRRK